MPSGDTQEHQPLRTQRQLTIDRKKPLHEINNNSEASLPDDTRRCRTNPAPVASCLSFLFLSLFIIILAVETLTWALRSTQLKIWMVWCMNSSSSDEGTREDAEEDDTPAVVSPRFCPTFFFPSSLRSRPHLPEIFFVQPVTSSRLEESAKKEEALSSLDRPCELGAERKAVSPPLAGASSSLPLSEGGGEETDRCLEFGSLVFRGSAFVSSSQERGACFSHPATGTPRGPLGTSKSNRDRLRTERATSSKSICASRNVQRRPIIKRPRDS